MKAHAVSPGSISFNNASQREIPADRQPHIELWVALFSFPAGIIQERKIDF